MKWILHPIAMAMAMEKMGIMETDGGADTVMTMENIQNCPCCRGVNEP